VTDLTRRHVEAIDATLTRYLANPMPRDLNQVIKNLIEPHTMNSSIDHGDVMDCIHVAWPVIRDYVQRGPSSLPTIVDYYEDEDE
jgi:hypothetical protein